MTEPREGLAELASGRGLMVTATRAPRAPASLRPQGVRLQEVYTQDRAVPGGKRDSYSFHSTDEETGARGHRVSCPGPAGRNRGLGSSRGSPREEGQGRWARSLLSVDNFCRAVGGVPLCPPPRLGVGVGVSSFLPRCPAVTAPCRTHPGMHVPWSPTCSRHYTGTRRDTQVAVTSQLSHG